MATIGLWNNLTFQATFGVQHNHFEFYREQWGRLPKREVNNADQDGNTALCKACESGFVETVEVLLGVEGMEVNHRNTHGQTPLYLACEGGHEDVLRVLLQVEGAELSTGSARTPLSAAAKSGHLSIVMMLLAHPNVDVNGVGKDGCTALWHASANGHQVVVQCLLSQTEVDVNKASPHGTPLIQACIKDEVEVAQLLLHHSATQVIPTTPE